VKVHGIVWAGVRTERFDETMTFFRAVLGVPLELVRPGFGWSRMPDTSQLEIFGPDDVHHTYFTTGPVVEFLVQDVFEAARELEAAGVEILAEPGGDAEQAWLHFRAPDGNVYGLTHGANYRR
jgi:predicted enzyme related to lactoylglutathione lyase